MSFGDLVTQSDFNVRIWKWKGLLNKVDCWMNVEIEWNFYAKVVMKITNENGQQKEEKRWGKVSKEKDWNDEDDERRCEESILLEKTQN